MARKLDVIPKRSYSTNESRRLSLCKKCMRVWEWQYQSQKTLYYQNFPTYKLERKTCKECNDERK